MQNEPLRVSPHNLDVGELRALEKALFSGTEFPIILSTEGVKVVH